MTRCTSCEAALHADAAFCSDCGAEISEDDRDALEDDAEQNRLTRARRLVGARRLSAFIGLLGVFSVLLSFGRFPPGPLRTSSVASALIFSTFMFALWRWSRRSPIPAVICVFAIFSSGMVENMTRWTWTPGTIAILFVQLLILRVFVRGLRGGLGMLAEREIAGRVRCAKCGEPTHAGEYCGACGAAFESPMAPESRAVPKLSALLVVFTTGLALALIPVDLPASVVAPEHVETFAVLATAILVCALAWGTRRDLVSLLSPKNVRAVHALPTLCILASFVLLLPYISLAESLGLRFESVVETYSESGGVDLAMVSFMCVVVPFVEEIAFRGYTLRQLGRVMSAREALIVQAMLFAAVHVNVLSLPSHFLAGLALGWLRQRTGNLYPSILAHGAWNALVIAHDVARSSS